LQVIDGKLQVENGTSDRLCLFEGGFYLGCKQKKEIVTSRRLRRLL